MAVSRLLHDRDAMRHRVRHRERRGVPAGADHQLRFLRARQAAQLPPHADATDQRLAVVPHRATVERMGVEQRVREFQLRQDVALDAAFRADEERLYRWTRTDESARDGYARIKVSARASARDE